MRFDRIAVDPQIMGGVPCIAGTRIPVETIVSLIAGGETPADVAAAYPQLALDDVTEALQYAAEISHHRESTLRAGA